MRPFATIKRWLVAEPKRWPRLDSDRWKPHAAPSGLDGICRERPPWRSVKRVSTSARVPRGQPVVIEFTSQSTRDEDVEDKLALYRDILEVSEYFLFDPHREYLDPQLIGYRLRDGVYELVASVANRLPSKVLGLHLEADGGELRLYDPAARRRLPTTKEDRAAARAMADEERRIAKEERKRTEAQRTRADEEQAQARAERQRADTERQRADTERQRADVEHQRADVERKLAEERQAEIERLRHEIEFLKRRPPDV